MNIEKIKICLITNMLINYFDKIDESTENP